MDETPCFSTENASCRIAGFAFDENFDCKVCLKTGYIKVIRMMVKRGHADRLTAAGLQEKMSGKLQEHAQPRLSLPCKYRGKLLQRGSCKCGDGSVWECLHPNLLSADGTPGRQIGRACGEGKCKGYVVRESDAAIGK